MSSILLELSPNASLPSSGSHGSAGLDLAASEACSLNPGQRRAVSTGVKMALPLGTYGKIEGRSGLAIRNGIIIGGGVIDSDYTGEIKVILINTGNQPFVVNKGDRIAQLIVQQYMLNPQFERVEKLPTTERGTNGFGSTGIKQYFKSV
tara:strand:+ start:2144 stop:2590 length:447 start_codon:yes stop_codon:yes gene_type:complete